MLRNIAGHAKYNALSTTGHHTKTGPSRVSNLAELEKLKRTIIDRHVKPSNLKGLFQVANTLVPLAALWTAVALSPQVSYWLTAVLVVMITFLQLRVFIIMHECGHSSLFKSSSLNKAFGFVFGLLTGMPQYVWAQRHHYHHSTNGNWSKYQGPLNIITVDKYAAMTQAEQRKYRNARSIWLAPIAGLMYLLITPRITLVKGTISLVSYLIKQKIAQPSVPIKTLAKGYQTTQLAQPIVGAGAIEITLDLLQGLQHAAQLGRVVCGPRLLGREPNPCPVGTTAHIGPAEGGRRGPGGLDQLSGRQAGIENPGLQRGRIL